MIAPRKPAPALTVPLLSGSTFTLSERRPRNFTVMIFYRGKHCPICSKYLDQVHGHLDRAASSAPRWLPSRRTARSVPAPRPPMDHLLDGLKFVLDKNGPARGDPTLAA